MRLRTCVFAMTALVLAVPALHASTITVDLGQSAQNYVLTGTGNNGSGFGTYYNTQGSCVAGVSTTVCSLTGSYSGSTPGYTSGTYDFLTTYQGTGISPLNSISTTPGGSFFNFSSIPSTTTMYLQLADIGGSNYDIPIFAGGSFDINSLILDFASTACGGTAVNPCTQGKVGLVNGATFYGPVTTTITFNSSIAPPVAAAVPEPSTFALMGTGILGVLGATKRKLSRS